jgi:hypothetical protein
MSRGHVPRLIHDITMRILLPLIAAVMLAAALTACGGDER